MPSFFSSIFFVLLLLSTAFSRQLPAVKQPDLTPQTTTIKINEIMKAHATYKELNPVLIKRILQNYLENLDPVKTYFIETDIHQWLEPSDKLLDQIEQEYKHSDFHTFELIHEAMASAIERRHTLEKQIDMSQLPKRVKPEEFKDMKWANTEQELLTRLTRIKALQIETASKLNEETKEKSLQRMAKRQTKYEDDILTTDPVERQRLILVEVLKATASSLDSHSSYFTPDEATQYMINV
ncbi:MAG: carboxy terminal-processing peptidase, partial [Parachlamydiaceae bacterium]|nr:carboxy terminal-processing peptidase [Parachlamydiaceae bacterium]